MKTKVLIALVAMVLAVACDKDGLQKSEHERAIENVVAQCQNFDCTTFAQELPGVWKLDTDVNYDENWEKITDWCLVLGEYNNDCIGWRGTTYTFTKVTYPSSVSGTSSKSEKIRSQPASAMIILFICCTTWLIGILKLLLKVKKLANLPSVNPPNPANASIPPIMVQST